MVSPSRVLIENTLKSSFNLIVYTVYRNGEEHDTIVKLSRKKLLAAIDLDQVRVQFVDKYPPSEMQLNLWYVKRDGKTVWVRENKFDGICQSLLVK